MYVCVCRGITDRDIRKAIAEGASSVSDVAQMLGAGTGCGTCRDFTQELIQEARSLQMVDQLTYAAA
jgi:bacterioferritin-associated ferredoxin